ncbi:hypothetical protein [Aridibaculum aurantiacum]|uniref:hypothetical protein n=1 Tax=Aridibaculum aurantiacum TaxID=2810307 RepID=UPI001A9752C9|nr:hypothetical protein [Aridibaculum aurantiacum]
MKNIKLLGASIVLLLALAGCKKESQNIFNMFDVQLTLHQNHPFSTGEYKEVNDGDSVYIDFTITSPTKDMYQVAVLKAGSGTPFLRIPLGPTERRTYSGVVKLAANENAGATSYRIWAYDKDGVYLGDGYKLITIYVRPNFTHLANRNIYYPDSANKSTANYFSLSKGISYNYASAQANSGDIDLAIYQKPLAAPASGFTTHIYSLSATPLPYIVDNISSFTKRETLFSAPVNNHAATFNNTLTTGSKIETEARRRTINLKSITANIPAGNVVYFRTPEGKYGALLFNTITTNYSGAPFVNVSVKYQH